MKVIVSGKNISVRPSTRDYVEEKLEKFDKYFKTEVEAKVTLGVTKDRHTVEVTMPLKNGVIFRAEETSEDLLTSVDLVIDKLGKQMRKITTEMRNNTGSVQMFSETLTDGSKVYEVQIIIELSGTVHHAPIPCRNEATAISLFEMLMSNEGANYLI